MNVLRSLHYLTIVVAFGVSPLWAQVGNYQAPGNPTSQGWSESPDGGFPTVGDGTDTKAYWSVNDDSNNAGAYVPSDLSGWNTEQPWQIEAVMRLESGAGPAEMGFGAQAIDEDRYFRVDLATDGVYYQAEGNAATAYYTDAAFDASVYHTYELTVHASAGKPSSDQVTLHIDGQLVADLTRGGVRELGVGPTMNFGSGSSGGRAELRYHSVQLTHDTAIVPEPTAGMLLGLSLFGLTACMRSVRRR